MRNGYARITLIAILAAALEPAMPCRAAAVSPRAGTDAVYRDENDNAGMALRQYLTSVLQNGTNLDDIPRTHPLYPLRRVPLVATTTFLLLGHDAATLERFYPVLENHLLRLFGEERLAASRLVMGGFPVGASDEVYLSPALNAVVNIEIYSLGLIAQRIGRYEDALELIDWSRRFTQQVTKSFYDPSREAFMPVQANGRFIMRNAPHQILPLLLDREIDEKLRKRIVEKCLLTGRSGDAKRNGSSYDPLDRAVIRALLSALPYFEGGMPGILDAAALTAAKTNSIIPAHRQWLRFWSDYPTRGPRLFPVCAEIGGMRTVACIFQREALMNDDDLYRFVTDVESLESALKAPVCDLESHKNHIAVANRLLTSISTIDRNLESGTQIWKVFDESRWRALSPRTKKLVTRSLDLVVDELFQAKILLSKTFMRSTGITAEIELPDGPVPLRTDIQIEATIGSAIDSLELSNIYLQIGENRWRFTQPGQHLSITPRSEPLRFVRSLPVAPGTGAGLMTFPFFFDFLNDGRRVEIHQRAHIGFVPGRRAVVHFPDGRTLGSDPITVQIILRYAPDHDIRGVMKGTFLKGVRCTPALPARFLVKEGTEVTKLPLELSCVKTAPPGIYPLSLSLELNGEPIAVFEEKLVRPLRWLYLGPLTNISSTWKHALYYQDNLFAAHSTTDGRTVRWREVPAEAVDREGHVIVSRLSGAGSHSLFLFYTMIGAPTALKTVWRLENENDASIWINGDLVFSTENSYDADRSGPVLLREGGNSILVAVSTEREPARIAFSLSDLSGLPVAGLGNDVASLIDGYHRFAAGHAMAEPGNEIGMRFAAVTLKLDYPNAADVCVIGSFNNWEAGVNPMRLSEDGLWTAQVTLTPGRYPYKFLIDRTSKITDPGSPTIEPDGFGGFNSILVVKKNGR